MRLCNHLAISLKSNRDFHWNVIVLRTRDDELAGEGRSWQTKDDGPSLEQFKFQVNHLVHKHGLIWYKIS